MRPLQVRIDVGCSLNEFRRLIGRPDVVRLVESAELASETMLLEIIRRRLDPCSEALMTDTAGDGDPGADKRDAGDPS
jgi:hypothetical protein